MSREKNPAATSAPGTRPERGTTSPPPSRNQGLRTGLVFGLGAFTVLFAVLNLDEVKVSWIIGTWQTPLIVVIVVSTLLGAALGWYLGRRRPQKASSA